MRRATCGLHVTAGHLVRLAGITAHRDRLAPAEVTVCCGVPVTTPERTFLDVAFALPSRLAGECLDDAIRRGVIHLARLRRLADASEGQAGRHRRRAVVDLLAERPATHNPGANDWEKRMDELWDRLGLEAGVRQHRVRVNGHSYFLDRAIPDLKIGAEWNGYQAHHLRSDVDHDAIRAAELTSAGWHIIHLTAAVRPELLRDSVQRMVVDRRRWLAPAPAPPVQPSR